MACLLAEDRLPGAGAGARVAVPQAREELLAVRWVSQALVVAEPQNPGGEKGSKERQVRRATRYSAGKGQWGKEQAGREKGDRVICQEIISILLPHIGICIGGEVGAQFIPLFHA